MSEPRKKIPNGRGSREWKAYPETTEPPEGQRAEGREMEMIESLAVISAIQFFACRARLKPSEQDVLNSVIHHTVRYGHTEIRASHGFLAVFTGYAPKTHGAPLKGLDEKGFIEYQQGSPKKSATGHRHTQSYIRVRIPDGWEAFKDNSWIDRFGSDDGRGSGGGSPFEDRPSSKSTASKGGDQPLEGLESRDLPVSSEEEGLETPDPVRRDSQKVSNLQTQRSRISRPYGLESRDLEGLEFRGPEGLEFRGTKRGDLKRGDLEREDLGGETQTDPLSAEQKLGASNDAHPKSASDEKPARSSSRRDRPQAEEDSRHISLMNVRTPEDGAETSARAALDTLIRHVKTSARTRLTVERRDEIITGCTRLLEKDPEIETQDLHYLLGLWAGDRALENANHLYTHMRRNKRHLARLARDMEAQGKGDDDADPDEWLQVGLIHGQQKRSKRLSKNAEEDTPTEGGAQIAASRSE